MTPSESLPNRHDRRPAETLAPLAYRVPDACAVLGIGRTSLYELMAAGKLRAIRIAGRTLVDAESARALIASAPARDAT